MMFADIEDADDVEAVDVVDTGQHRVSAVVRDITMPRMDGLALVERLEIAHPTVSRPRPSVGDARRRELGRPLVKDGLARPRVLHVGIHAARQQRREAVDDEAEVVVGRRQGEAGRAR